MEKIKRRMCAQPKLIAQHFDINVSGSRMGYILTTNKKWINGTELRFMFIEGDEPQKKVVRDAFKHWKELGIGLSFKEVTNVSDSLVRIGFDHRDGSWSYVGRDILTIPKNQRTMNFGWDLTVDSYGLTTALHEIGHTLGFNHEHQNSKAGIVWDTQAVYAEFSGAPNHWTNAQIDSNILTKMPENIVQGSVWDPDSIMEYEFGPGLVIKPDSHKNGIFPPGTLSSKDIQGVKSFYPAINTVSVALAKWNVATPISASPGGQNDFIFVAPTSKKFTFQTTGLLDSVMTISERTKEKDYYMAGDDDSGTERNTKVSLPLVEGREYLISIRVMFAEDAQSGALVIS